MNLYRFAPAIVLLLPLSAAAGPREDALSALARCSALKDDTARLACYDGTAAQLQSALSAPPPPPPAAPPPAPMATNVPPPPPTPEQKERVFGFDGGITGGGVSPEDRVNGITAEIPEGERLDSITSELSEITFNAAGRFTITLGNGQVWQQLSGDESFARYKRSAEAITITIERGFVGSFSLHFSDQAGTFKVRRNK